MSNTDKLFNRIDHHLDQLVDVLDSLNEESYCLVCKDASASIGQHIRHALEIFALLVDRYDEGLVNYDLRKRDLRIETDIEFASLHINKIKEAYKKPNKTISVVSEDITLESSYNRELFYQLEHIVHHNAIIKPIIKKHGCAEVSEFFGYNQSTIKHRKANVSS